MKRTPIFTEQQIALRTSNSVSYVTIFEIRSFTFTDYLLTVNTEKVKYVMANYTLKEWLSLFPRKLFLRVDKQTYLNVYFLKHYCTVKQLIHLTDCTKTALPTTFKKSFFSTLKQATSSTLVVEKGKTFMFINKAHVFLLVKDGRQTQIGYMESNGCCHTLLREDIKSVCSQLQDYDFRQCNRSSYINLHWCTGQEIDPISRKKYLVLAKDVKVLVGRTFNRNLEDPVCLSGQCENVVFRKLFCYRCAKCTFQENSDA